MRIAWLGPLIVAAVSTPARADRADDGWLVRAWDAVAAELEQARASLEPAIVPPQPIEVTYQARRVASIDLGAPLLALEPADLDGDGREELYALTSREVLVLAGAGRDVLTVRERVTLPGEPASIRPRDPVGTAVAGAGAVELRSSLLAEGARVELAGERPAARASVDGFPLCAGVRAELEPGRNYFVKPEPGQGDVELPEHFYALRCRDDLVDPSGRPMSVRAHLPLEGPLVVRLRVECEPDDEDCAQRDEEREIDEAGFAYAVADVDNDGRPEVITSSDAPRGAADSVRVIALDDDGESEVYREELTGGVVGVAAGDLDGDDATDLIAAVRIAGSHRVDLWRLN